MLIKIQELEVDCKILYRSVKNARIEIKDGDVRLILPHGVTNYQDILEKNKAWIHKKLLKHYQMQIYAETRTLNLERSEEDFRNLVTSYILTKSKQMQVNVNKLSFRKMKSRWGSCSAHRNISINTRLKYLPSLLIKYVCFHELAHLIEQKHDKNFWKLIEDEYTDYHKLEKELGIYWLKVKNI